MAVGKNAMVTEIVPSTEDGEDYVVERPASVGDMVFGDGIQGTGTFCEYAAVMSSQCLVKPPSLSMTDAASVPLAALTAYQALTRHAIMIHGSKVLVLGGSGGVGSWAVQIAKALGCHVAATSSDLNFLRGDP